MSTYNNAGKSWTAGVTEVTLDDCEDHTQMITEKLERDASNAQTFTSSINLGGNDITNVGSGARNVDTDGTTLDGHGATLTALTDDSVSAWSGEFTVTSGVGGYIVSYATGSNEYDPNGNFNTTTGTYTAPEDGVYFVVASFTARSATASVIGNGRIYKNTGSVTATPAIHVDNADVLFNSGSVSWIGSLTASDTIRLYAARTTGSGDFTMDGSLSILRLG
jgi:hypothetical protein